MAQYKYYKLSVDDLVYYGKTKRKTLEHQLVAFYHGYRDFRTKNDCYMYPYEIITKPNHTIVEIDKTEMKQNQVASFEMMNESYKLKGIKKFHEKLERSIWNKHQYENHKEKIMEKRMEKHDQILEYAKNYSAEYRQKNHDKVNQKCDCECGGKYTMKNKTQHLKSKKHKDFLSQL